MNTLTRQKEAEDFAKQCHALGFSTYLAESREYGFVTDAHGTRVLSFFSGRLGSGLSLSGNYLPSRENGTGWQIAENVNPPRDVAELEAWLNARVPSFVRGPLQPFTTCRQYLDEYQASSRFKRLKD